MAKREIEIPGEDPQAAAMRVQQEMMLRQVEHAETMADRKLRANTALAFLNSPIKETVMDETATAAEVQQLTQKAMGTVKATMSGKSLPAD